MKQVQCGKYAKHEEKINVNIYILKSYAIVLRNDSFGWLFLFLRILFETNKNTLQITLFFGFSLKILKVMTFVGNGSGITGSLLFCIVLVQ